MYFTVGVFVKLNNIAIQIKDVLIFLLQSTTTVLEKSSIRFGPS